MTVEELDAALVMECSRRGYCWEVNWSEAEGNYYASAWGIGIKPDGTKEFVEVKRAQTMHRAMEGLLELVRGEPS